MYTLDDYQHPKRRIFFSWRVRFILRENTKSIKSIHPFLIRFRIVANSKFISVFDSKILKKKYDNFIFNRIWYTYKNWGRKKMIEILSLICDLEYVPSSVKPWPCCWILRSKTLSMLKFPEKNGFNCVCYSIFVL